MFGPNGINAVSQYKLYFAKVTVTKTTFKEEDGKLGPRAECPADTVPTASNRLVYYVARYVDANGGRTPETLDFNQTVSDGRGNILRDKGIDFNAGATVPELRVSSDSDNAFAFVLNTAGATVRFDPPAASSDLLSHTAKLDILVMEKGHTTTVGSLNLAGVSRPLQELNVNTASLAIQFKTFADDFDNFASQFADAGTNDWVKQRISEHSPPTASETAAQKAALKSTIMAEKSAFKTMVGADGKALAEKVFDRVKALYSGYAVDVVDSVVNPLASVKMAYQILPSGLDGSGLFGETDIVDLDKSVIQTLQATVSTTSLEYQAFELDAAINRIRSQDTAIDSHSRGVVRVLLASHVFRMGGSGELSFVNYVARTIAHEGGHALGLPHPYDTWVPRFTYFGEPIINQDQPDIMGYASKIAKSNALRFTAYSDGILKVGLDGSYRESDVKSAESYLLKAFSTFGKDISLSDDGTDDSDFVPVPLADGPRALLSINDAQLIYGGSIDFGATVLGESALMTLTVWNLGNEPLRLDGALLQGSGSFRLRASFVPVILDPGKKVNIELVFDPSNFGAASSSLQLVSNDGSLGVLTLTASAHADYPSLTVEAQGNNLGGVLVGSEITKSSVVTITNQGVGELQLYGINLVSGDSEFALVGVPSGLATTPLKLAAGESFSFGATSHPSTPGLRQANIQVLSNDSRQPALSVGLTSTGLDPDIPRMAHWGNNFVAIEFPELGSAATIRAHSDAKGNFEAVLPASRAYHVTVFDPATGLVAHGYGNTNSAGVPTELTRSLVFQGSVMADSDFDGLPDDIEFSIGTSETAQDSDGDGVSDFAEILVESNPLDSRFAATAILAGLSLQGQAKAISADQSVGTNNPVVAVASGTHGIALVDVSSPNKPLLLREVDLAGDSTDVAFDGTLGIAAVASNGGGLNLVDLAGTVRNIAINASSVEVADGIAYANNDGQLRAYDLLTGERLQTLALGVSPIVSMAREGQMLYTVDAAHTLRAIDIASGQMVARGSLLLPTAAAKLFVGGGIAYIGAGNGGTAGFMTAKVTNPDALTFLSGVDSNSIAGTAIAATGSGIGVAVGSSSFVVGGFRSLDLLDLSDPTNTAGFLRRINLPQVPYDVSIAAGLAFVADGTGGLQVVNYRAFDNRGVAPTVGATTSLIDVDPIKPGLQVQEGGRVVVTPTVTDDVQVRNVELLVGGKVVRNDLSFPFDLSGALPTIAANGGTNVTLQVRATDTGGNFGLSAPIEVELVPDTFGPHLLGSSLKDGATVGSGFRAVTLDFSESIDPLTLGASAIQIVDADGTAVNPDNLQFRRDGRQLHATFAPLAVGAYTLRIDTAQVRDRAGNAVGAATIDTRFTVKQFSVEWINPAGGDWNTAANWSTGAVPLASDDVFIGLPENVTVTISGGTVKVASLVSNENLVLAGGTLAISGEARIDGSFRMSAGTVSGTGTLLLAGTGNQWSGGAMSGGGTTRIPASASVPISW